MTENHKDRRANENTKYTATGKAELASDVIDSRFGSIPELIGRCRIFNFSNAGSHNCRENKRLLCDESIKNRRLSNAHSTDQEQGFDRSDVHRIVSTQKRVMR